jgi:hypothetical protein
MANTYDIGDTVRCAYAFTDEDGTAVDPDVVIFRYKTASVAETSYTYGTDAEVVRDSAGNYHVDLTPDTAGIWYYRWEGDAGAASVADETFFTVRESQFAAAS